MPSAPERSASSSIRVIASSRAWYMAWRQDLQLHVLVQFAELEADVVDRAAHHQAERLEAGLLDQQELVDGEVAGEERAAVHGRHPAEAVDTLLGDSLRVGGGRRLGHSVEKLPQESGRGRF